MTDIAVDSEWGGFPPDEDKDFPHKTLKDFVETDISAVFFNLDEHAEIHTIDGKEMPVIFEDWDVRKHSSHWEGGAKQNFDVGLYNAHAIMYVRKSDLGRMPQQNTVLTLDRGSHQERHFQIRTCEEEGGVYRLTLERRRQG